MKSTKRNIEFFYLYRDAGNYKKYDSVVFAGTDNAIDLEVLQKQIREHLFDEEFFYPYLLDVPLLHFDNWDTELDHHWYSFQSLSFSDSVPNDKMSRTIEQFIADLKQYAKTYVAAEFN